MKCSSRFERERVINAGGHIWNGRVEGILEPTRTLGDDDLKSKLKPGILSAIPEVRCLNYSGNIKDRKVAAVHLQNFDLVLNESGQGLVFAGTDGDESFTLFSHCRFMGRHNC
jgi:hypothetical protein